MVLELVVIEVPTRKGEEKSGNIASRIRMKRSRKMPGMYWKNDNMIVSMSGEYRRKDRRDRSSKFPAE
jgi:hypothetical protein